METPKLGQLIPEGESPGRDAVHVAVVPMTAAVCLLPGERVGFDGPDRASVVPDSGPESLGIVDPFLNGSVAQGQRFWLVLYPGSITSLRHQWTHPAFVVRPPAREKASG